MSSWRVYAFTDRAAYRPGESARWKLIARQYDGALYSTPSNRSIYYEIFDPRGTKVDEQAVTLNDFGSGWSSLELTDTMPLGEYRVTFSDEGRNHIGDVVGGMFGPQQRGVAHGLPHGHHGRSDGNLTRCDSASFMGGCGCGRVCCSDNPSDRRSARQNLRAA